jgi:hypothetical protein
MKKRVLLIILNLIFIVSIVFGIFIVNSIGNITPKASAYNFSCEDYCTFYAIASCPDCSNKTLILLTDLCVDANCSN